MSSFAKTDVSFDKIACHECDLSIQLPQLLPGEKAACPRCGFLITRNHANAQDRLTAYALASVVFFLLSLIFPFLDFISQTGEMSITLFQSLSALGQGFYVLLVLFMLFTTLLIPLVMLVSILYIIFSIKLKKLTSFNKTLLRIIFYLKPWNMAEIFLLGILVSMVKIESLARIELGFSFYAFVLFILANTMTIFYLDRFQFWRWIHQQEHSK